jgi:hypothetical protein
VLDGGAQARARLRRRTSASTALLDEGSNRGTLRGVLAGALKYPSARGSSGRTAPVHVERDISPKTMDIID